MKKIFVQPEWMVVNINKNDIIATSNISYGVLGIYNEETMIDLAPDRRFDSWYEGY